MWVLVTALKMPKIRVQDQARASILTFQKLIFLKIVVHIFIFDEGLPGDFGGNAHRGTRYKFRKRFGTYAMIWNLCN